MLDLEADSSIAEEQPWTPQPEPPGARKVLDVWGGVCVGCPERVRGPPRIDRSPGSRSQVDPLATVEGAARFARHLAPTHALSIEGQIGPHRAWGHPSVSLADVKAICATFGGTVNDVVLSAVSGGYRRLLIDRGDDASQAIVRSLVPVSTRR